MKKVFLLSYEMPKFLSLHDWIDFKLQIEIVWLWGLFKTHKTINYKVYDYQDFKSFTNHWDKLIEKRLQLKVPLDEQ